MNSPMIELPEVLSNQCGFNCLTDICRYSFNEFRKEVCDHLSWSETRNLYRHAQQAQKDNRLYEARIIKRANPQLQNAVHLGITVPHAELRSYNNEFGDRANQYTAPGAVSSMFSPAAYLTELYREARNLHTSDSIYCLDNRRPDLKSLVLSQQNMNTELSTLSLSNELLLEGIKAQSKLDSYAKVMEMLSTFRPSGATPYHDAYENVRKVIQLQDPGLEQLRASPALAGLMSQASLLGINASISPELFKILTEEITETNAKELYEKNFGKIEPASLAMPEYLRSYYNLSDEELSQFIGKAYYFDENKQEYNDNQLITKIVNKDGTVYIYRITREYTVNTNQINEVSLFPLGGDNYQLNYNFKDFWNVSYLSIRLNDKKEILRKDGAPQVNTEYKTNITLSKSDLNQPFEIYLKRVLVNESFAHTAARFTVEEYNQHSFLLKLNKAIRLSRATKLSPTILEKIILSVNQELDINADVLGKVFLVKHYMQHYGISADTALILCNATISQRAYDNQPSQFDRLFNTPPLNGQYFSAEGEELDLTPDNASDWRKAVLKRAFNVDDISLYRLFRIANHGNFSGKITNNIENLSTLYRAQLLAETHQLSIDELDLLLVATGEGKTNLSEIKDNELASLINKLYSVTDWLHTRKWNVYQLFVMTTTSYDKTLTPEIHNLLDTVYHGLQCFDKQQANLLDAMSPYIAATLQLPSEHIAHSVLLWADKLQPGDGSITGEKFWIWLQDKYIPGSSKELEMQEHIVQYCQALAQLGLIYHSTGLSENAFRLFVTKPEIFGFLNEAAPNHDALSLVMLTHFADWVSALSEKASTVLTAFKNKTLTAEQLANAMNLDANLLLQASIQAQNHQQVTQENAFSHWTSIDIILQWVGVAHKLNVSPQGISALVALDYIQSIKKTPTYAQWKRASEVLTAGLDIQQTDTLHAFLDESRSAALSTYYIREVANATAAIRSRDDLYQYLLIDNQVSAAIKTTRISEAIASLQLYINRALENVETNADSGVISRQFFIDWDKYNKRYSTWSGISQLTYYPENYIDPTMRIGQTKMMDTLLQSVSQSQLNSDTVEDAFMSYLTSLEQVANLQIVSAYHDNINNDQGLTYFIGRSETDAGEYYWRSVDHSKFSDGKFAANAWSEWSKIDCPINPYQSTIRPVIYKSRLYLIWLEQKEIVKQKEGSNQTEADYRYELKLAHIRYDGTWNTPITFDVNSKISNLKQLDINRNKALGLYCANNQEEETLLVLLYCTEQKPDDYKKTDLIEGMHIFSDMVYKDLDKSNHQSKSYLNNVYKQFDTHSIKRVNNRYTENYEIPSSVNNNKNYDWGDYYISYVYGGNIPIISYKIISSNLKINISPSLIIAYGGFYEQQKHQCNLMKKYGKLGDKFIIYTDLGVNKDSSSNKRMFYPVYQYSGNTSALKDGRLLFYRNSTSYLVFADDNRTFTLGKETTSYNDYIIDPSNKLHNIKKYTMFDWVTFGQVGIATDIQGPIDINTAISPAKVQVIVKAGSKEQTFTADKNVSTQPSPSFEGMYYQFNTLEIDGSGLNFINNSASIDVTFTAFAEDGRKLGWESFNIPVTRKVDAANAMALHHDENGAQYMQWGIYRTRLNTLFARQLVNRATTGIDTILSMETQNIQEPQLGKGFYATFVMPPYNPSIHGDERWFKLYIKHVVDDNSHIIYSGQLGDTSVSTTLFIPLDDVSLHADFHAKVYMTFKKSPSDGNWSGPHFVRDDKGIVTINPESILTNFESVNILKDISSEPMDFSGSNSLYFWELFYYTPMLVAQRLLHEQNFDEANRWLKYVWSPSGYIVHGQIQNYQWNVRPLLENTSWNSDPLDSVDPDAVAQHDPMHYKVSTFMRTLDLLITRGDYSYRQLERDTLNEAKMWYMQALHLLGDKPYLPLSSIWSDPRLDKAADVTTQQTYSRSIVALRQGAPVPLLRTANSLTDLFLPQTNEVMMNYWQTLEQRLYNLRHNLSIDGQPLYLPIYATPTDPKALLSAAVANCQGGGNLPQVSISLWRFPHMLENARSMVSQLTQFGSTLQNIIERQDAEALNALLQNQAAELILTNLSIQDKTIEELDAEKVVLEKARAGAQSRFDSYSKLYDENINTGEDRAMTLRANAAGLTTAVQASRLASAAADLIPNIFGLAGGGSRWGAIAEATGYVMEFSANVMNTEADKITQSETYRRRRQEWEIQRNNAETEIKQIDAQLKSLTIRREAAVLQKTNLKTQQEQTQAQLAFLQRKFSNQALYNWLRGRLAAIYFQFYDLAVARCLMAELAYHWETNDTSAHFIKPGAWQGTYAGLLAGETLMLSLAQMEDAHLKRDQRALEVERTVSLAEVYAGLSNDKFNLAKKISELVTKGSGSAGNGGNQLAFGTGTDTKTSLQASISLSDLNIRNDYPASIGKTRRIKQISVSLPTLLGPYQDVQAILSYSGDTTGLAKGCKALAISHGTNDSGQFQLDFNDGKFLPFEGIAVDDKGTLTLSFPNATSKQQTMLQTLNDIILHIRYTILK
ncbi:neuraminidase-like domain-containing protein [Photorhabdus australis]|uniref:Tc toxin subunit A-related protein n=1 Tax=Photorhabdus australis TaxID=286156 RepID=UPI00068AFE92|nr:neuraminidase-like domain-containing protein [Photorhabdus australis]